MSSNWILVCTLLCGTLDLSLGGIGKRTEPGAIQYHHLQENNHNFQATKAEDRIFIPKEPLDIFTKWGPFGYFNEFADPSNAMGPEILKGFGVPFTAYNGFNLMESVTTPPLEVPMEATSTSIYGDGLHAPEGSYKPKSPLDQPGPVGNLNSALYGSVHANGYGVGGQQPSGPAALMSGYTGPSLQIPVPPTAGYTRPGYSLPMPGPNPAYYSNYAQYPRPPYNYPAHGRNYYV